MDAWVGVPADRVVAVIARLPDGRSQWASGFLVARDRVLTAWHCTVDRQSKEPAVSLSVVRESDGRSAEVDLSRIVSCHSLSPEDDLDVAVLALAGPPWDDDVKAPRFARVDRGLGAELVDCQAVGYPNFQRDPEARVRNPVELHGPIRRMEDRDSGYLILRDQILQGVGADPASPGRAVDDGAWGGLSGALVFFRGYALGHVVQHQPRQGWTAVRLVPIDRLLRSTDSDARRVADALGLPASCEGLPWAESPPEPGAEMVGMLDFPFRTEPGRPTPSGLLRAWDCVVQFTGQTRRSELDGLLHWAHQTQETRGVAFKIITAPAGCGKTRLALEACRELDQAGWLAGFVSPSARDFSSLTGSEMARFLVLDDAVAHLDQLRGLADAASSTRDRHDPAWCVVVLTRKEGSPAVRRLLDAYPGRLVADPVELQLVPVAERPAIHRTAVECFMRRLPTAVGDRQTSNRAAEASVDLPASTYEDYFSLLASALLEAQGRSSAWGGTTTESQLREDVLESEAGWWSKEARDAGLFADPDVLRRVVALSSLVVTRADTRAEEESKVAARLRLIPDLEDARRDTLRRIARWEQGLYGGDDLLNPMRPHLLASHAAAGLVEEFPSILADLLDTGTDTHDAAQVVRTLTTLLPSLDTHPKVGEALRAALAEHLDGLVALAIHQANTTAASSRALSLEAVLAHALAQVDVSAEAVHVARRLPAERNLALDDLALALQTQEVTHLRRVLAGDTEALAAALRRLSRKRADMDQPSEALAEAAESVRMYLATATGTALPPPADTDEAMRALIDRAREHLAPAGDLGLADALSNLALRLDEADKRTCALQAAEVSVLRLPPRGPDCADPTCRLVAAEATSNYSRALRDAGRLSSAVEFAKTAVEFNRELQDDDPRTYRGNWATAERRYARCLGAVGRYRSAARHAQRAVDLFETAARTSPERWQPDLAKAHQGLAEWLAETDRLDEAMDHVDRALALWEQLGDTSPITAQSGRAHSRIIRSTILHRVGNDTAAEEAARGAVEDLTDIRNRGRSGFDDSLAVAYLAWADSASDPERAVHCAQQAVNLLQDLRRVEPAFARDLCRAQLALADHQGRTPDALQAAEHAVESAREAAGMDSAGHLTVIVKALLAQGEQLHDQSDANHARDLANEAKVLISEAASKSRSMQPDGLDALRNRADQLWNSCIPAGSAEAT